MPTFGRSMLEHWLLDPECTYLNHGTVGATPRRVLQKQQALRDEMERQPSRFMLRELNGHQPMPWRAVSRLREASDQRGGVSRLASRRSRVRPQRHDRPERGARIAAARSGRRGGDHRSGVRRDRARGRRRVRPQRRDPSNGRTSSTRCAMPAMWWSRSSAALTPRTKLVVDRSRHRTDGARAAGGGRRGRVPRARRAGAGGRRARARLAAARHPVAWRRLVFRQPAQVGARPAGCGILWAAPERQAILRSPVVSWGRDKGFRDEFEHTATGDPTQLPGGARGHCPAARVGLRRLRRVHARAGLGGRRHSHGTLAHDVRDPARHGGDDGHGAVAGGCRHHRCRCGSACALRCSSRTASKSSSTRGAAGSGPGCRRRSTTIDWTSNGSPTPWRAARKPVVRRDPAVRRFRIAAFGTSPNSAAWRQGECGARRRSSILPSSGTPIAARA